MSSDHFWKKNPKLNTAVDTNDNKIRKNYDYLKKPKKITLRYILLTKFYITVKYYF